MSTDRLIEQLLAGGDEAPSQPAFEALRTLLDDSTVEVAAAPKGIADAARALAMATSTLRYYEREGLVSPARDAAGHRAYGPEHMRRLVFCTRMRLSGMSVGDLKAYLDLVDQGSSTIPQRRDLMLAHRAKVVRRQRELALALEATDFKIAAYGGHPHP